MGKSNGGDARRKHENHQCDQIKRPSKGPAPLSFFLQGVSPMKNCLLEPTEESLQPEYQANKTNERGRQPGRINIHFENDAKEKVNPTHANIVQDLNGENRAQERETNRNNRNKGNKHFPNNFQGLPPP